MALAQSRPIHGAVATLGVSDRVAFLRRTYAHLGVALLVWAGATAGMMRFMEDFSLSFSRFAFQSRGGWLLVLVGFMVVNALANRMARSDTSRGIQYLGLGLLIGAWTFMLQPILWYCIYRFGPSGGANLVLNAALITGAIFVGLTLTVFVTKKDFSFLRGILMVSSFAALGIILASLIFGFALGAVFMGAMIALMAGYILFQTSAVMRDFPPSHHVAAALMLFSTIATLFWYVLQFLISMRE